jgi:hypothetical protein
MTSVLSQNFELTHQELKLSNKYNFNHFGRLMIKAAYPGIAVLKLSTDEIEQLKKFHITHPQSAARSLGQFFIANYWMSSSIKK